MDEPELSEKNSVQFLDLPWEHVLCCHILPYLDFRDLFALRCVSRVCLEMVETHFSLQFHLNTCSLMDHCSQTAFSIMTRDCTCLKTLILRGAKSWLTNEVFLPVITSNPQLEKIDLTDCLALSGCCVYAIGANCPHLRHLSLRNCVWLSQENLVPFVCRQRTIEYLDFSGCWNLDDETIIMLAESCPNLKQLLLSNIYGLTDRAICAVARCCRNLQTLSIKGCWRVSDCSISLITEYCTKLKMLQAKECRDVTEKSLGILRRRKVIIDVAGPTDSQVHRLEYFSNLRRINLAL